MVWRRTHSTRQLYLQKSTIKSFVKKSYYNIIDNCLFNIYYDTKIYLAGAIYIYIIILSSVHRTIS